MGEDAYLRWRAAGEMTDPVLVDAGHTAWCWRRGPGAADAWATVVGDDPAVVARLIDELARRTRFGGVTIRESIVDALPERLRPVQSRGWCSWTLSPDVSGDWDDDPGVVDLDRADPRIDRLLRYSDSAYIGSDDESVTHWVGVVIDGELASVGASHPEPTGAAHLVSICTHPDRRGRGLAERVCRVLVARAATDDAPMVYLEMYADNDAARAVYRRLGMVEHPTYRSGPLPDTAETP